MSTFKTWLESLESESENKVRQIWADTFDALGLGGLSDEDAAHQSLSKVNYGQRSSSGAASNFKGKRAVYKRLENRQIFNRLSGLNNPEASKAVEDAKQWLGQNNPKQHANADTTVSSLLEKLFGFKMGDSGDTAFHQLIDSDAPQLDRAALQKAPAMPPKTDQGMPDPSQSQPGGPEQPPPAVPQDPAQAQQAPAPGQQPMMPPQPAGMPMGM